MALLHELDPKDNVGALSDESMGISYGEIVRDYEPAEDTKWRFGKPNYARVNKAYFIHRAKRHRAGSLEAVVSKVVKNWEVESHHISDVKQWKTMDVANFNAMLNGGAKVNAQLLADIGPYNMLVGETPQYSAKLNTLEGSNTIWSRTFPDGFAWEVLEVLSGPPTISFKWRHFGQFTGEFIDKEGRKHAGTGEMVDVVGMCIATVTETLLIQTLDIYYNPDDLLKPLVKNSGVTAEGEIPVLPEEDVSKPAPMAGCSKEQCSMM